MSIGAVLVVAALALLVGAYLTRPFRRAWTDPDRMIERWVDEVRKQGSREQGGESVNFCPQCGRKVGPDDRSCAGCGAPLREG